MIFPHVGEYSITLTRVKPKRQSPWLQAQLSRHFPESNMTCPLRARSVPDRPSKPQPYATDTCRPPKMLFSGPPSPAAEQVVSPVGAMLVLLLVVAAV